MIRIGRLVVWDDDEVDSALWMPLILFLARCKDEGVYPPMVHELDFRDFMLMHGIERKPRPFVYAYKHSDSRRYVHVDADGNPYRFLPIGDVGQYRAEPHWDRAVHALNPWFIRDVKRARRDDEPWMRDDDEPVDDGWMQRAIPNFDEPPPARSRSHLRLVE